MSYSFNDLGSEVSLELGMFVWCDLKKWAKAAGWEPIGSMPARSIGGEPEEIGSEDPARHYSFNDGWRMTGPDAQAFGVALRRHLETSENFPNKKVLLQHVIPFFEAAIEGVGCY